MRMNCGWRNSASKGRGPRKDLVRSVALVGALGLLGGEFMRLRFQFRRYRLTFRTAVRTAHGVWSEREGILVRVSDEGGLAGLGEAACLPWFGTETADAAEAACTKFGEWVGAEELEEECLQV